MRIGIDARKIADFGIGTYIRGLLRALIELRGDDQYVAFAPEGAPLPDALEHIVVDAPHYSIRELVAVGRAADRAGLDVFHAPHYVVPFTRVPVVVTIHDLIHLHQPMRNPLARIYARTMLRRATRKAARVLTVTETVKRQLIEELRCDPERIVVTPNGIDPVFRQAAGSGQRAANHEPRPTANGPRPTIGGRRPTRYFLFVGNDKPHKNVDDAVDAIARVPDAELVLAGAPFERFRGREHVVVRGFVDVDALAELYRGAIALLMPSREEGFGLPAAEAMACGTAVITSNAPALVEITGDAALHVDLDRHRDSLAEAMLRVARDETLRATLASRGIARAMTFTWKRCAEITRSAYHDALRAER